MGSSGRQLDPTTGISTDATPSTEQAGERVAGLVLLYAENFAELPPVFPILRRDFVIGRETDCDAVLPAQGVSRKHARIGHDGEVYRVEDLESRNGILLNGGKVKHAELHDGDVLRIGDALFKFATVDAQGYRDYRIDGARAAGAPSPFPGLVGGYRMSQVGENLARLAASEHAFLLLGATGTGKEVLSRGLHQLSGRAGAFCAINCAAIPETLLESELFGYRRGAFSGATRDKPGLFELANGGTLLLDEIGDMPLAAQAKLLRVIQAREVFPLGGSAPVHVDVRIVSATHKDIRAMVDDGRFRGDLYARLGEFVIRLPSLRDRKEDIFQLADAFARRHTGSPLRISFPAMVSLLHHDWPFNVRELESCIKTASTLAGGAIIEPQHLPEAVVASMRDYGKVRDATKVEGADKPAHDARSSNAAPRDVAPPEALFREVVERHRGNVSAIARELGKERPQIHRWLKRYGIDPARYRE